MLTEQLLRQMMPSAGRRLDAHLRYIGPALAEGRIDTPKRIAAWMAQAGHESGEYLWMAEIWGPTDAQLGYEGAARLGNTQAGDGHRFMGRGPFQITGRDNYTRCGTALGLNLVQNPDLLMLPEHATRSAVWFWNDKVGGLSPIADQDWFRLLTRLINGGFNGLEDRLVKWHRNRHLLGLPPVDIDTEVGRIMEFQAKHGLVADGAVGPKTMAALKNERRAA
jgi:putative chitinase